MICGVIGVALLVVLDFVHLGFYCKYIKGRDLYDLSSPNKLTPFTLISLLSVLTCSVPVFVGCAFSLCNSISQDQEFFIALDTFTVTGIMIHDSAHSDGYAPP
jgi:hypothetical protein